MRVLPYRSYLRGFVSIAKLTLIENKITSKSSTVATTMSVMETLALLYSTHSKPIFVAPSSAIITCARDNSVRAALSFTMSIRLKWVFLLMFTL